MDDQREPTLGLDFGSFIIKNRSLFQLAATMIGAEIAQSAAAPVGIVLIAYFHRQTRWEFHASMDSQEIDVRQVRFR